MFFLTLADMSGVDWMVRHGRGLALAIAVKSAPERLCGKEYCDTVTETILTNATADRVRIRVVFMLSQESVTKNKVYILCNTAYYTHCYLYPLSASVHIMTPLSLPDSHCYQWN